MERAARLRSLWSWLPAFRAVAETEHLPTASERLHVSASSLSRTIRLLEDDIGAPLFDRVGRQLVLNEAGRGLLRNVRLAMRSVDEALLAIGAGQLVGKVVVHVPGPYAALYVLPAMQALTEAHPGLIPHVTSVPTPSVADELRRGAVDVAVLDAARPSDDLTLVELAELPHGVFCGPGHPLHDVERVTRSMLEAHAFVAPTPLPDGAVPDRWPTTRPRRIGLYVTHMEVGIDACLSGGYLTVLPVPVAERAGLRRLPARGITGSTLCVMHRPTIEAGGRAEAVVRAITDSVSGPLDA